MRTIVIVIAVFGITGFLVMIFSCLAIAGKVDDMMDRFDGQRACKACLGNYFPGRSDAKHPDRYCSEGCEKYARERAVA